MADALGALLVERFSGGSLRLGTRTSPMAMHQAQRVADLIIGRAPAVKVELIPIKTSADLWPGDLSELGGKGTFTKEIDRALMAAQVDIAVHCMKDVPGDVPLPAGTAFGAYLPRDDVRDVVVTRDGSTLADLPAGALVGTSSVRRRAQLGLYRPDLRTERIRGAVGSRVAKLDTDGRYDALILACAGLARLEMLDRVAEVLPIEFLPADGGRVAMVPAVGAGIIGIQARTADVPVMQLLDEFNHQPTARDMLAERTMLHMLRGHCNSPIAGYATTTPDGQLSLFGMVFNRDGSAWARSLLWGDPGDPATLGSRVASDLLHQGARYLITATRK
ncbi:porphobilinogen deaminase 2 [Sphaerisporangium krabiense]|uniref:Porphobilinogen deaminase n=1 Tax=Sphaerisporangium krabiense TaxID=763782 RepID=A0A7W8Z4Z0_9ACTN|nr:hydroxymethylbilane synthase [Sphaerisporangium krabiense]MBB5627541.1 hydroxymethylbilane synthase [Sphaerisporangium krabiense]GII66556.1 porphobilinogen deaminase 2 [Sphaerisporangium krabiense]